MPTRPRSSRSRTVTPKMRTGLFKDRTSPSARPTCTPSGFAFSPRNPHHPRRRLRSNSPHLWPRSGTRVGSPRMKGMTSTRTAPDFSLRSIAIPAFGPALLFCIGEGAILPGVALSARDLGASVAVSALIVTLIGLGSWLFNLPASLITLKFGERWSIVGAAAAGALALVGAGLSSLVPHGVWLLAVAMTVVGMSASVFSLARQKYLTEAVPVAFRARALSTLGGVTRIGVFIGPFIGAGVMQFAGIAGAYWVGVVGMACAA